MRGGSDKGEVWYTGTLGECIDGYKSTEEISETDKANTIDIVANPTTYDVSMNGTPLVVYQTGNDSVAFTDSTDVSQVTKYLNIELMDGQFHEGQASIKCPTDITTVEVTVTKK